MLSRLTELHKTVLAVVCLGIALLAGAHWLGRLVVDDDPHQTHA
jgi:hypothetical protein